VRGSLEVHGGGFWHPGLPGSRLDPEPPRRTCGNLTSSHAAPPAVVTQDAYPVSPRRTDTPPGQEANSFWHLTLVVGPGASLLW
jgi:hypothetical protein